MSEADKLKKGLDSDGKISQCCFYNKLAIIGSTTFFTDDFDSDLGDDELDEELALPSVLAGISYAEKKELYRFKQTHNEVTKCTINLMSS